MFISWKKIYSFESDSNEIDSLCFVIIVVVWTMLFFNIENDFRNYIFIIIFMFIDLGVNRSSYRHYSDILDHLAMKLFVFPVLLKKCE